MQTEKEKSKLPETQETKEEKSLESKDDKALSKDKLRFELFNRTIAMFDSEQTLFTASLMAHDPAAIELVVTALGYSLDVREKILASVLHLRELGILNPKKTKGILPRFLSGIIYDPVSIIKLTENLKNTAEQIEVKELQKNIEILMYLAKKPFMLHRLNQTLKKLDPSVFSEPTFFDLHFFMDFETESMHEFRRLETVIEKASRTGSHEMLTTLLVAGVDIRMQNSEGNFVFQNLVTSGFPDGYREPNIKMQTLGILLPYINSASWNQDQLRNVTNILLNGLYGNSTRYESLEVYGATIHTIKNLLKRQGKTPSEIETFLNTSDNFRSALLQHVLTDLECESPLPFAEMLIKEGFKLDDISIINAFKYRINRIDEDLLRFFIFKIDEFPVKDASRIYQALLSIVADYRDDNILLFEKLCKAAHKNHEEKTAPPTTFLNLQALTKTALAEQNYKIAEFLLLRQFNEEDTNKILESTRKLHTLHRGYIPGKQSAVYFDDLRALPAQVVTALKLIDKIDDEVLRKDSRITSEILEDPERLIRINRVAREFKKNGWKLEPFELTLSPYELNQELQVAFIQENHVRLKQLLILGAPIKDFSGRFIFSSLQHGLPTLPIMHLFLSALTEQELNIQDRIMVITDYLNVLSHTADRSYHSEIYQNILELIKVQLVILQKQHDQFTERDHSTLTDALKALEALFESEVYAGADSRVLTSILDMGVSLDNEKLLDDLTYNVVLRNNIEIFQLLARKITENHPTKALSLLGVMVPLVVEKSAVRDTEFLDVLIKAGMVFSTKLSYRFSVLSDPPRFYDTVEEPYQTNVFLVAAHCGRQDLMEHILKSASEEKVKVSESSSSSLVGATGSLTLFREKNPIDCTNDKGNTALILSARKNQINVVKFLIEKKADLNIKNSQGFTALMEAALYLKEDTVKLLLAAGAHFELEQLSILHEACKQKYKHLMTTSSPEKSQFESIISLLAHSCVPKI